MLILAADVGGTNVRLQLANSSGDKTEVISSLSYASAEHDSFGAVLRIFIDEVDAAFHIDSACLAVAGPVTGSQAKITNLPWVIDAQTLCKQFNIDRIRLINDFEGVAYGIARLHSDELVTLQSGEVDAEGAVAVIGAGTGLGHALSIGHDAAFKVLPSEAGHMDFAPRNTVERDLYEYMRRQAGRVSCESVISGPGLVSIYNFLCEAGSVTESDITNTTDPALAISERARQGDLLATQALELFMSCYGAHCGNMALAWLPRGGIYLAGSIAPGNIEAITRGPFLQAFLDKAPMQDVLSKLPVHVVRSHETGLRGALYLAGTPA